MCSVPFPIGTVAKLLLALNINKGPWLGGDWLNQKSETLTHLVATYESDPSHFDEIKDFVIWDQDLPEDVDPKLLRDSWFDMKTFTGHGEVSVMPSACMARWLWRFAVSFVHAHCHASNVLVRDACHFCLGYGLCTPLILVLYISTDNTSYISYMEFVACTLGTNVRIAGLRHMFCLLAASLSSPPC